MRDKQKVGVGVGVMILRGGKVLLGLRHADPAKADSELHGENTWTMPGGKLEFGEELENACVREVSEETGLKIPPNTLKLVSVTNDRVEDAHFITLGFLCADFQGEPEVKEPDEITRWEWFPIEQLPKPMFFCSEKIIKNYISNKIY
ncbi:MAG: NUDIX domain-containing protein [Patescibacteria group bacterium]|nr:NUDIX domain-containing protein [Patescibacteria group bacterium]